MFIFHPRADAPFPLSHTFFFSHRQVTLVQQVNFSLVPKVNCMHRDVTMESFCRGLSKKSISILLYKYNLKKNTHTHVSKNYVRYITFVNKTEWCSFFCLLVQAGMWLPPEFHHTILPGRLFTANGSGLDCHLQLQYLCCIHCRIVCHPLLKY